MWKIQKDSGLYLQERVTDPYTGKSRYVSVRLYKDTPAGRKEAAHQLAMKINRADPSNIRLSDLFSLALPEQEHTLKQSSIRRNKKTYDRVVSILGDPLLSNLSAGFIRQKLLATGKAPATLNEYIARLKPVLRWGYRNDYIKDISVIEKLYPFKEEHTHREKIQHKFLESYEVSQLLDGMTIPIWKLTTEFMVLSGLRFGEVAALDKSDIAGGYIRVHKTLDVIDSSITSPKTLASNREVYIQPELQDCIARIDQYLIPIHSPYFLCDLSGERISYASYNNYLKRNARRILNRDHISTHVLRHTHVSLLAAQGIPLDVISRRVGHEDSKITREIYLHVTSAMKDHDNAIIQNTRILK